MLVESLKSGGPLPERKLTEPESVPTLQELAKWAGASFSDLLESRISGEIWGVPVGDAFFAGA